MNVINVAVVQASPVWFDRDATIEKTVQLIADASKQGASLVAFPELWVPGYPVVLSLVASETATFSEFRQRYAANSFTVASPQMNIIERASAEYDITVILGFSEIGNDNQLFMSTAYIDPERGHVGTRRKISPSGGEGMLFGSGGVEDIVAFREGWGTLTTLSCFENRRPLLRHLVYEKGARLHVAAWPSFCFAPDIRGVSASLNMEATSQLASEGGIPVLAPTMVMTQEALDRLAHEFDVSGTVFAGGGASMIFDGEGLPLVKALRPDQEGILVADVDLDAITPIYSGTFLPEVTLLGTGTQA